MSDIDERVDRKFAVIGTGQPFPQWRRYAYIGTFQIDHGALVYHVFEVFE